MDGVQADASTRAYGCCKSPTPALALLREWRGKAAHRAQPQERKVVDTVIYTDHEDVVVEMDLEAEIGQDEVEARSADEIETEQHDCCYSPNRFCEVTLYPYVWDELQTLMVEWAENFFDAPAENEAA